MKNRNEYGVLGYAYPWPFTFFDMEIESLYDVMVPLRAFNKTVEFIERFPGFKMSQYIADGIGTKIDITDETLVIPYSFIEPIIISEPLQKIFKSMSDENAKAFWKKTIIDRAKTFVDNSLHINQVDQFNKDNDLGVIVHMLTGNIVIYDKENTTDLVVIHLDNTMPELFTALQEAKLAKENGDFRGYGKYIAWLNEMVKTKPSDKEYRDMYWFKSKDPNSSNTAVMATISSNAERCLELDKPIVSRIIEMVQKKIKIILTA